MDFSLMTNKWEMSVTSLWKLFHGSLQRKKIRQKEVFFKMRSTPYLREIFVAQWYSTQQQQLHSEFILKVLCPHVQSNEGFFFQLWFCIVFVCSSFIYIYIWKQGKYFRFNTRKWQKSPDPGQFCWQIFFIFGPDTKLLVTHFRIFVWCSCLKGSRVSKYELIHWSHSISQTEFSKSQLLWVYRTTHDLEMSCSPPANPIQVYPFSACVLHVLFCICDMVSTTCITEIWMDYGKGSGFTPIANSPSTNWKVNF